MNTLKKRNGPDPGWGADVPCRLGKRSDRVSLQKPQGPEKYFKE